MLTAIWWIGVFIIWEAMIGYPITLIILDKILKREESQKDKNFEPTVTLMIVVHNEEKVIKEKLENAIHINYPKDKIEFLITSDYSTDNTNMIVDEFIKKHPEYRMKLYKTENHYGKTNAQNEAQKLVESEILVMTDANSMLGKDTVKEIVSSFADKSIAYVSGQLEFVNPDINMTTASEGFYWKIDLKCRDIESRIQTITAGNGAIYAVRNKEYIEVDPIECHDSVFPLLYALDGKRAIYNKNAVAYEKAGEVDLDEFKRKVRMNRSILKKIIPDIRIFNIKKSKWFTYFYFGHRTCRYLLWFSHATVLAVNLILAKKSNFWKVMLTLQTFFYGIGAIGWFFKSEIKMIKIVAYYCMTISAQWKGVLNCICGRSKAIWDKSESMR